VSLHQVATLAVRLKWGGAGRNASHRVFAQFLLDELCSGLIPADKEHLARFLLPCRARVPGITDRVLMLNYGEVIAEGRQRRFAKTRKSSAATSAS
jgi:hypothetical protein